MFINITSGIYKGLKIKHYFIYSDILINFSPIFVLGADSVKLNGPSCVIS